MSRRWIGVLAAIFVAAALAFVFRGPLSALSSSQLTQAVYLVLWLVLIAGGAYASRSGLGPHWLRNAALWLVILIGVLGAYSIKDDLGALLRPAAPREVGQAIELRRAADGHFWADVRVNGEAVRMMIDTGASDVALTPRDARKLGFDPESLAYTVPVSTAEGESMAAPVTLDEVRLGSIALRHVRADVMRADGASSLLGMSFLDRLGGYEVHGDRLTLRPAS